MYQCRSIASGEGLYYDKCVLFKGHMINHTVSHMCELTLNALEVASTAAAIGPTVATASSSCCSSPFVMGTIPDILAVVEWLEE